MIVFRKMGEIERITFKCPLCDATFTMPKDLKDNVLLIHYQVEHPNNICKACNNIHTGYDCVNAHSHGD